MNMFKRLVVVTLLCGLAITYVYQHSCSQRVTRRLLALEKERQLLNEKLDSVNVAVVQLTEFERLEAFWDAQAPALTTANAARMDVPAAGAAHARAAAQTRPTPVKFLAAQWR